MVGKHHSLEERYRWLVEQGEPAQEYTYFGMTRNPWDMLVSRCHFLDHDRAADLGDWDRWLERKAPRLARKLEDFFVNRTGVELASLRLETLNAGGEERIAWR